MGLCHISTFPSGRNWSCILSDCPVSPAFLAQVVGDTLERIGIHRNRVVLSKGIPSIDDALKDASSFQASVRKSSLQELICGAFVCAVFALYFFVYHDTLTRAGSALVIAGEVYAAIQIRRHRASEKPPPDANTTTVIAIYHLNLKRQRDLHRQIWLFCLLPLTPGLGVLYWGWSAERSTANWIPYRIILVVSAVLLFSLIWIANEISARRLQQKIDKLQEMGPVSLN